MTPLLLSKRRAAALLGIGRTNTLQELIESGKLRVVRVAGRVKVPLEEVQRIAREGTEPPPKYRKQAEPVARTRGRDAAAELRAMKF